MGEGVFLYSSILFINVYKLKDEWYYVEVINKTQPIDTGNKHYYKCDQFDGLIDCLKMIKSNEN